MPIRKNPERTDAQRRALQKYDKAHYTTLISKVSISVSDAFRSWCSAAGLTVSGALSAFVRAALAGDGDALRIAEQFRPGADRADDPDDPG